MQNPRLISRCRYGHLSDGKLHLVVIKRCSRLMYLRFLLRMAHIGLEAGGDHGDYIKVIPALAVRIEPVRGGVRGGVWIQGTRGPILGGRWRAADCAMRNACGLAVAPHLCHS